MTKRVWVVCVILLVGAVSAWAHVGNPDVYAEGQAGPYKLFVVIRPPIVIPGVADIEVRAETPGIGTIRITPVPLTGEAAAHPPVPDTMKQPSNDKQFFTGHLWMMAIGSWQIRFAVSGAHGTGTLSVPVPATAMAIRKMTPGLGVLLTGLGVLLLVGLVGIVGAAAREAKLPAGDSVPSANRRNARVAMIVTFAVLVTGLFLGNAWWKSEAAAYEGRVYKPLQMEAAVQNGNVLDLKLRDPGWLEQRRLDDFIPDHDHLMHLYMIRWPAMDIVFHLHPQPTATAEFQLPLPSVPAGTYRLYADVVHRSGFPETIVGTINIPAISGRPLSGDDAKGTAAAVAGTAGSQRTVSGASSATNPDAQISKLPDGYTMVWRKPASLVARAPEDLEFELLDPQGKRPSDMGLYMGMLGHAAFVSTDGTTFAHVHPTGTVSMAAFMMANYPNEGDMSAMPGMNMEMAALPNIVGFPYGFPSAGTYRIFVQMKHGTTVETGVFDAAVGN
jgi:hypothetical protein